MNHTAVVPANFILDEFLGTIRTFPQSFENIGTYQFIIEACVFFQDDEKNCAPSNTFTVKIRDSCYNPDRVNIVSTGFQNFLRAAQEYTDSLNLQLEMGGPSSWPWTVSLENDLNMPGLCGTITYELLTDTYLPQTLVQFNDSPDNSADNFFFAPTI